MAMDFARQITAFFRSLTDLFSVHSASRELPVPPSSERAAPRASGSFSPSSPPSSSELDDEDFLAEHMGQIVPLSLEIARLNDPLTEARNADSQELPRSPEKDEKFEKSAGDDGVSEVERNDVSAGLADGDGDSSSPEALKDLRPFAQPRIVVSLLKGGVGKTTMVCFLATAIEELWRRSGVQGRLLVVDTDPQGSATDFFLSGEAVSPQNSLRALFPPYEASQAGGLFHGTRYPCIDVLPSHVDLADVFPDEAGSLECALARYLQDAAGDYGLILIDTPPSDTLALRCALMAGSGILMPIDPSRQSLKTFSRFARTFVKYRRRNAELKICGVVFSRYDRRLSLDNRIREAITRQLNNSGIDLYEVPRRAAVAQIYNDYRGFEALDAVKDGEIVKVFADMALKILSM